MSKGNNIHSCHFQRSNIHMFICVCVFHDIQTTWPNPHFVENESTSAPARRERESSLTPTLPLPPFFCTHKNALIHTYSRERDINIRRTHRDKTKQTFKRHRGGGGVSKQDEKNSKDNRNNKNTCY